jgi:hypothetical protein
VGLTLTLCGEGREDPVALWHALPKSLRLDLRKLSGSIGTRIAEDLVRPLRLRAQYVVYKQKSKKIRVMFKSL